MTSAKSTHLDKLVLLILHSGAFCKSRTQTRNIICGIAQISCTRVCISWTPGTKLVMKTPMELCLIWFGNQEYKKAVRLGWLGKVLRNCTFLCVQIANLAPWNEGKYGWKGWCTITDEHGDDITPHRNASATDNMPQGQNHHHDSKTTRNDKHSEHQVPGSPRKHPGDVAMVISSGDNIKRDRTERKAKRMRRRRRRKERQTS